MRYDANYATTVATVIPVIFVMFAVDLGLTERPSNPRIAAGLASVVILLLLSELLCLTAIGNHRELGKLDQIIVASALLFSGMLIFLRVAGPLLEAVAEHGAGRLITALLFVTGLLLVLAWTFRIISGRAAADIFGLTIIVVGWIAPSIIGGPFHRSLTRRAHRAADDSGDEAEPSPSDAN
jgi:hypothetical protein